LFVFVFVLKENFGKGEKEGGNTKGKIAREKIVGQK